MDGEFCNLTEVVVRNDDDLDTLTNKTRLATILGTIQATYTKFPYLRKDMATKHRRRKLAWC